MADPAPYCARFHLSDDELPLVIKWFLDQHVTRMLVASETGKVTGKDHHHMIWKMPDGVTIQAFRKRFKRHHPDISGNQKYSMKRCDDDAFYNYVAKEGKVWSPTEDITAAEITHYRNEYLLHMKLKRERQKKWSQQSVIQSVIQKMEASQTKEYTPSTVVPHVMDYYIERRRPMNEFHMKSVVTGIVNAKNPDYKEMFAENLLSSVNRAYGYQN